ncbi:hypothetical protein D3C75_836520 [compost metagenome]
MNSSFECLEEWDPVRRHIDGPAPAFSEASFSYRWKQMLHSPTSSVEALLVISQWRAIDFVAPANWPGTGTHENSVVSSATKIVQEHPRVADAQRRRPSNVGKALFCRIGHRCVTGKNTEFVRQRRDAGQANIRCQYHVFGDNNPIGAFDPVREAFLNSGYGCVFKYLDTRLEYGFFEFDY